MHSDIDFDTDISGRGALRARAQTLLEFNAIRERVADRATYFPARQMALGLQPSYDEYEVALLQQETAEGRAVLDESGEVDMYSPDDIGELVVRASIGGVLTGMELLAIAQNARCACARQKRHPRRATTRPYARRHSGEHP